MQICWYSHTSGGAPDKHSCVCQGTLLFTPLADVSLPSRSLCCRPGLTLSFMFVLWEPQVFFTQDKKAEEEAETMASCFPLRTILFSGFISLVFLSHHLSNVSVLPAISQEKREEANLKIRKIWSHLTHLSMGLTAQLWLSSPVHNKLPSFEWALGRWVVLQCWSGRVTWSCAPA